MVEVMRMEFRKLRRAGGFKISLLVGIVMVSLQFGWFFWNVYIPNQGMLDYVMELQYGKAGYGEWYENGILEGWMGCEPYSPYNQIYFFVFPLLAAFPFGISLCNEWRSGYASQVVVRCGRKRYFVSKFIMVFVGGGMAVALPLLVSLLVAACFLPVIPIDPLSLQAPVRGNDMLGVLYYENPVGYALSYVGIDFIFGGIFACMTLVISRWIENRFAAVCFPLLMQCVLVYGVDGLFSDSRRYNPVFYINPSHIDFSLNCNVRWMLVVIGGLLAVLVGLYLMGNHKIDAIGRRCE